MSRAFLHTDLAGAFITASFCLIGASCTSRNSQTPQKRTSRGGFGQVQTTCCNGASPQPQHPLQWVDLYGSVPPTTAIPLPFPPQAVMGGSFFYFFFPPHPLSPPSPLLSLTLPPIPPFTPQNMLPIRCSGPASNGYLMVSSLLLFLYVIDMSHPCRPGIEWLRASVRFASGTLPLASRRSGMMRRGLGMKRALWSFGCLMHLFSPTS
ncbi:hypothetical protein BC939DRAFT_444740 [Gamsiella multidivaricata]|uniref:uncharacterized protein n=1 Tax=Gamsiella multidivaricata TaxID=101098 RepID=UPI002220FEB7|nr:uncharacterized protein BC939DRAFT_444740 [Gamsiella multidivaricata]KAI7827602.1 hypothetical protein BC939DRAFT_444740 [Gamsiella multidivaricata]